MAFHRSPFYFDPDDLVRNLPHRAIIDMAVRLYDHSSRDYKLVAEKLGFSAEEIGNFIRWAEIHRRFPSELVLVQWSMKRKSTIRALKHTLFQSERYDVISLLDEHCKHVFFLLVVVRAERNSKPEDVDEIRVEGKVSLIGAVREKIIEIASRFKSEFLTQFRIEDGMKWEQECHAYKGQQVDITYQQISTTTECQKKWCDCIFKKTHNSIIVTNSPAAESLIQLCIVDLREDAEEINLNDILKSHMEIQNDVSSDMSSLRSDPQSSDDDGSVEANECPSVGCHNTTTSEIDQTLQAELVKCLGYHSAVGNSKKQIKSAMGRNGREGQYILRHSAGIRGQLHLAISVRSRSGKILHYLIDGQPTVPLYFVIGDEKFQAKSLQELLQRYRSIPLPKSDLRLTEPVSSRLTSHAVQI